MLGPRIRSPPRLLVPNQAAQSMLWAGTVLLEPTIKSKSPKIVVSFARGGMWRRLRASDDPQ